MTWRVLCLLVVTLLPTPAIPWTHRAGRAAGPVSSGQRFYQAHFRFTLDLYGALVNQSTHPNANMLFSPVGVAAILSPLLHTQDQLVTQQIRQVLQYSNMSTEEIQEGHTAMINNFADVYYSSDLRLAYNIFLQEASTSAQSALRLYPPSTTQEVNFHTNGTQVM
ncbi:hypothetical protein OTU49_011341, partial [Cherax quadricarinatus]